MTSDARKQLGLARGAGVSQYDHDFRQEMAKLQLSADARQAPLIIGSCNVYKGLHALGEPCECGWAQTREEVRDALSESRATLASAQDRIRRLEQWLRENDGL